MGVNVINVLNSKEITCQGVKQFKVAQGMAQWRALVAAVIKLLLP
jgi:hypothetical protein